MFELNGPSPIRFDGVDQLASVVEDLGERVPAFHDCLDARSPDEEVAYDESPIGRLLAFGEVSGLRDLSHDLRRREAGSTTGNAHSNRQAGSSTGGGYSSVS